MEESESREPLISRRALTRGAAWSVPAIAVAAAVPAYAASSSSSALIVGICAGRTRTATFNVTVADLPAGQQVQISLSMTGGTFTATPNFIHTGSGTTADPFVVTGTGGQFSGQIVVTFTLPQNGSGTVSALLAGVGGFVLNGTLSASVSKTRDGNSSNYPCT